jgi:hypothetical protein
MNHLISQEWQEIGLRNFLHMLFDARAFECDTFWICWGFQNLTIADSFFVKNCEKWTWYSKSLEAPGTHNVSHLKAPASIKSICTKCLSPISCNSWEIRWFIFNELTVYSTRSPVKHCPISKRKISPDLGDWALSSQVCARKIWNIRVTLFWILSRHGGWCLKKHFYFEFL